MNIYEQQVRKFYFEIWDKKNFDGIPNVLHEGFLFRGSLGQQKRGFEGFKDYVLAVHGALSNYKCIIDDLVVESDKLQSNKVFAKMTFTGIHSSEFMGYRATNKQVSWVGAALFIFIEDKVSSLWVLGDLKGLENQLDDNIRQAE